MNYTISFIHLVINLSVLVFYEFFNHLHQVHQSILQYWQTFILSIVLYMISSEVLYIYKCMTVVFAGM